MDLVRYHNLLPEPHNYKHPEFRFNIPQAPIVIGKHPTEDLVKLMPVEDKYITFKLIRKRWYLDIPLNE